MISAAVVLRACSPPAIMLSSGVIECVPNFSEGQDNSIIELIVDAASNIEGCKVIGAEPNSDYNRTVLTLAGTAAGVSEAAFRVISKSSELIDMRTHEGEHPRMGAVDVCPFVALDERIKHDNKIKNLTIRIDLFQNLYTNKKAVMLLFYS